MPFSLLFARLVCGPSRRGTFTCLLNGNLRALLYVTRRRFLLRSFFFVLSPYFPARMSAFENKCGLGVSPDSGNDAFVPAINVTGIGKSISLGIPPFHRIDSIQCVASSASPDWGARKARFLLTFFMSFERAGPLPPPPGLYFLFAYKEGCFGFCAC